eukprot:SAG25_NODE_7545_length_474_cov_0.568000_1_plen_25_part_01
MGCSNVHVPYTDQLGETIMYMYRFN